MFKKRYKKVSNSETIANDVMKNGILIGCHQGLKNDLNYIYHIFKKFEKNINYKIKFQNVLSAKL